MSENRNDQNIERPASPLTTAFTAILMFLILLIAVIGIIAHWSAVVSSSMLVVLILVGAAVLSIPLGIAGAAWVQFRKHQLHLQHTQMDLDLKQERLASIQDERRRANEAHMMNLHLAQTRLVADERGNRPFVFDPYNHQVIEVASGNYVSLPGLSSYRYDNRPSTTLPESQQGLAGAPANFQQPTLASVVEELQFNGLEIAFGLNAETGELVKTTLPRAVHMQLLGSSGQGKSRQATSLLTQLCARNDTDHLALALIDCEGETTAPFQALPHVRYLADDPRDAARAFRGLVGELERRDRVKVIYPVLLIFVEEFLNLRRTMPESCRDQALEDYTTLALRGRKRGMFLFSIGQTAYVERAIRDAQNQFLSSMAFAVKPTAARAAGFSNTDLLNRLYAERRPGQFLLERPAGDAILLAPFVETSAVPALLASGGSGSRHVESSIESGWENGSDESQSKASRKPSRNQLEPALQAKLGQVRELMLQGTLNKADILFSAWQVKPGNSAAYRAAEAEYKTIMTYMAQQQ